jgi:integrase
VAEVGARLYVGNPFLALPLDRLQIEDTKPIFVFDAATELAFLQAAPARAFPVPFTLAKTGFASATRRQSSAP